MEKVEVRKANEIAGAEIKELSRRILEDGSLEAAKKFMASIWNTQ